MTPPLFILARLLFWLWAGGVAFYVFYLFSVTATGQKLSWKNLGFIIIWPLMVMTSKGREKLTSIYYPQPEESKPNE